MSIHDHASADLAQLQSLATEGRNPRTSAIDTLPTDEMVRLINDEDAGVAAAVRTEAGIMARAIDATVERLRRGGRLIYVGAGTSGRLGVLDASECPPTFNTPPGLVVGLIAGGDHALRHAVENAEDRPDLGASDLAGIDVGAADVVVGIAASGRTPYVLGAVAHARAAGALTIGLACTGDSKLSRQVELMIAPIVGPEVITGSTRLKAGTAQKLVLNTLSTGVMVRLGKTYGNLMVDLHASNSKLRRRAVGIVGAAVEVDETSAEALLAAAEGEVKTAIVAGRVGIEVDEARRRLDRAGGVIRAALDGHQP
jgi:N-acetylmuramic acid 6-phosphate etherase